MGSGPTSGILKKPAIIIASKTRPSSARGNIKTKKKRCVALCQAPLFEMVLAFLVCTAGLTFLAGVAPVFTYSLWIWGDACFVWFARFVSELLCCCSLFVSLA